MPQQCSLGRLPAARFEKTKMPRGYRCHHRTTDPAMPPSRRQQNIRCGLDSRTADRRRLRHRGGQELHRRRSRQLRCLLSRRSANHRRRSACRRDDEGSHRSRYGSGHADRLVGAKVRTHIDQAPAVRRLLGALPHSRLRCPARSAVRDNSTDRAHDGGSAHHMAQRWFGRCQWEHLPELFRTLFTARARRRPDRLHRSQYRQCP